MRERGFRVCESRGLCERGERGEVLGIGVIRENRTGLGL